MILPALVLVVLQFIPESCAEQLLSAKTIPMNEILIRNPNDSVVLNCTVSSGGPIKSFTWTKGGTTLRSVNSSAGPIYWLGLTLNGNRTSAGLYTCKAVSKDNESDTADVAVHIEGIPQIIKYKSSKSPQFLNIYDDLDMTCYATGFPKPHLEWLRNGIRIAGGAHETLHPNYKVTKVENGLTLRISPIQKEDDNVYFTCVARNPFGNATLCIKVYVGQSLQCSLYRPTMKAQSSNQMSVTVGDRNVTLVCIGSNAKPDCSSTHWMFKGVQYDYKHDNNASYAVYSEYLHAADNGTGQDTPKVIATLIINNVSERDEGNFTCLLWNAVARNQEMDSIYLSVKGIRQRAGVTGESSALLVGLVVSGAVLVVIIIAAFVYHFWYMEKRRKDQLAQKYDTDGNRFKNDVFITYSGKDFNWVHDTLVPLFEEHSVQYIIHSRDFVPGKAVADNMADSVYQSRKVLVVMSKNYMASGYCKEEMQMALKRSLDDEGSPVIVIRIDNIGKKELPKSLRNKTFLDYTSKEEEQTWQKRLLKIVKVPESFHEESGENEEMLGPQVCET